MAVYMIRETPVTVRKNHLCCWCGDTIPKGEKALYRVYKDICDFFYDYMHIECDKAAKDAYMSGVDEWQPGDFHRGTTCPSYESCKLAGGSCDCK